MLGLGRLIVLISFAIPLLLQSAVSKAADIPAIAAASNVKFALEEISRKFTKETGLRVRISYGSSGNFVAQIKHGAPFQLFLSADERYIEQLYHDKVIMGRGEIYAVGRLALVASKHSDIELDPQMNGITAKLATGKVYRFAIANPDHAPYGERAKEALTELGLWQSLQQKLILGENAAQAAQFAISDSTQGGIIALSLAKAPKFRYLGRYIPLPAELHSPLYQRMALTTSAKNTAKQFYQYIQSKTARDIFHRYGFGLPQG